MFAFWKSLERRGRLAVILCLVILIGSAVGIGFVTRRPNTTLVEIRQDGELIRTVDLSGISEPEYITVTCESGINVIRIDSRGICIDSADCPDQTCVKSGYLKYRNLPIVCLPHSLTITYSDQTSEDEFDAFTG